MNFWNPYLETLTRRELTRIEFSYFKNIPPYAKTHSPLYREKLQDIDLDSIKTLNDVKRIPLTDKIDLRQYQEMSPLRATSTFTFHPNR